MQADTIDAIDNFINDASDQAAAWYSIVSDKPIPVPSATIAAQANLANAPIQTGQVNTPIGSYSVGSLPVDSSTLMLLLGAGVVAYLVIKAF